MQLDADGKAIISFDIPQFNGTARIMTVAWSKTGVGHATADVIIRDPVVVTASLPKFLAPGDLSELRLDIANTDAPAGDYQLQVTSNPVVTVDPEAAAQTITLAAGGKFNATLPLMGGYNGDGVISVKLSNASGLSLEQVLNIPVRPASLPVTTRRPVTIPPNGSLTGRWRTAGRQHPAGCIREPERLSLLGLRYSGTADDARSLPLRLRRADHEPRFAIALSERNGPEIGYCR